MINKNNSLVVVTDDFKNELKRINDFKKLFPTEYLIPVLKCLHAGDKKINEITLRTGIVRLTVHVNLEFLIVKKLVFKTKVAGNEIGNHFFLTPLGIEGIKLIILNDAFLKTNEKLIKKLLDKTK